MISGFTETALLAVDHADAPDRFVLHVFDVSGFASRPFGYWEPPRYEHPSWTLGNLGTVFGVTADDAGDVYLARSTVYITAGDGDLGGGMGAIIRIDGGTGAPSILVSLPQSVSEANPGLGNITWSCLHDSLFVTNFEDGRIYRIDPNAAPASRIRSAWDFATDTVTLGGAPEVGDAPGAAPKGERVWAVAVNGDRLFFSVWSRDGIDPDGAPNAIWSVALSPAGNPIPGTKTLEILLDDPSVPPMPVADLQFDGECCLFAAQRTMHELFAWAHEADLLRYCWTTTPKGPSEWVPTGTFKIGYEVFETLEHSASGGVAVDPSPNGLVWATGDFLLEDPFAYGVQGMPTSGGATSNSLIIDIDDDAEEGAAGDKAAQGSCEFVCTAQPGCSIEVDDVICQLGPDGLPTGLYSATLTIFNNSGQTATMLLLPELGIVEHLNPPLQSGQSATTKLLLAGMPGDVVTALIGLYDGATNCCGAEASFELPDCRCALFTDVTVECIYDGDAITWTYSVAFTIRNVALTPSFTAAWLFLIPPLGAPYAFTPTVQSVFPLLPGGQASVMVTLTFTSPPLPGPNGSWALDVPISIHSANLAICCDTILHLEGPVQCDPNCSPDLNGDGVVNGADLAILLGQWGGGAGTCADLNGDGVVNGADLAILLGAWG